MSTPNIILATGRCGSTLLSRCIAEHPDVLMISEFLAGLHHAKRYQLGQVSGTELLEVLQADTSLAHLWLGRGFTTSEVYGEVPREDIYRPKWRAPGLMLGVMQFLSDQPEALFGEIVEWCYAQPAADIGVHYQNLFSWLAAKRGKKVWIERSAFTADHLRDLARCFPDAKFLHIHRDGMETALSMRNHVHFKLTVSVTENRPSDDELKEMVSCSDRGKDPVVDRIEHSLPEVAAFGRFWTDSMLRLYRDIQVVPSENYLDVRFENLIADPATVLSEIGSFFSLPESSTWLEKAVPLINPVPSYLGHLNESDTAALAEACRPGQALLGREGSTYTTPALEVEERLEKIYDLVD